MATQQMAGIATGEVKEIGLLDQIVEQSKVAKSPEEHERAKDIISELASQVLQGTVVISDNLAATIDARIAELDHLISKQLSVVLHAPEFQKLEGNWTGLHYLIKNTSTSTNLKIKMINVSKKGLIKDFQVALDFDQSAMLKKVYEEELALSVGLLSVR